MSKGYARSKYSKRPLTELKVEYCAWMNARGRCVNPLHTQYKNYGARGITMCTEWLCDFDAFIDHIGPKPHPELSLDRINNDKGYEPGNVKWETRTAQQKNKRSFTRPNETKIHWKGETKTIHQWSKATGIRVWLIRYRINNGYSLSRLFSPPYAYRRPNKPKSDK